MIRYKLLKDLPFAKAGTMVEMWSDGTMAFVGEPTLPHFNKKDVQMFPLWFEEAKDYFYITTDGIIWSCSKDKDKELDKNRRLVGNYFETQKEAKEHLEWLKARTILLGDVKPHDGYNHEWGVRFDRHDGELYVYNSDSSYVSEIIFSDENDAYNSIEKHEEEWRTYFGVE